MVTHKYHYNLNHLFDEAATTNWDNPALIFPDSHCSYSFGQLNQDSDTLALELIRKDIKKGDVVALLAKKRYETFTWMIACLKVGAPYVMMDPDSPDHRNTLIFNTCQARALAGEEARHKENFSARLLRRGALVLSDLHSMRREGRSRVSAEDFERLQEVKSVVTGEDAAYIMFTSGSTGIPKGVVIPHANVMNLIYWSLSHFGFSNKDVLSNVNPLYFDNSVFDLYSSLFSGAALLVCSKEIVSNPVKLLDSISRYSCTSWFSVPSLLIFLENMKALKPDKFRSVTRIIFGGEGYPLTKLKNLHATFPDKRFYNVYGPTECTCICSIYEISDSDFDNLEGFPPIGGLLQNFDFSIVDHNGELLPSDRIGELILIGPNVGSGYINDRPRTSQAFFSSPKNSCFYQKAYKTGDLVSFHSASKKLLIHGRKDNQIKHLGYRIELEEIESALARIPSVHESAVLHQELRALSKIVAIVAVSEEHSEEKIRSALREYLPSYMIPDQVIFVAELKKNSNGKTDRIRLREEYLQNE